MSMRWREVFFLRSDDNINNNDEININDTEEPLVYCDNVVKLFKKDKIEVMALQGLDLTINKGEFMAIIGKSGSGKSTLLNMLGGLCRPSAGEVMMDGINLNTCTEKELVNYRKKTVGFVWQKSGRNLFNYLTSVENIEAVMCYSNLSAKEKREKAIELLELVGMSHKKNSLPQEMSGGEQQRVAIAVALANDPKILLADEPTGAVDSATAKHILTLFKTLNREKKITIIIVTHDMKLASQVDRIVMIADGKISTEKLMREQYRETMELLGETDISSHEEYSILDKANRIKLDDEILKEAGIDSKKVRIKVEDGRVIILPEK